MIPKKLHYIWIGGNPLPDLAKKCIESWKKFCPDYEIVAWDESNLNIDINEYCREAYDARKFAFASDVLRYDVVYREGGIYMDIDVELIKPIDDLLENKMFLGFETAKWINPGLIMGAEAGSEVVKELIESYDGQHFVNENGEYNYKTICERSTEYLVEKFGFKTDNTFQNLDGKVVVYPTEYFCPFNLEDKNMKQTENTRSIHWFNGSWVPKLPLGTKIKNSIKSLIKKIIGEKNAKKLKARFKKK